MQNRSFATKYSIEAYPTTLLVDKNGKHVATNLRGAMLEKAVELLLEGKSNDSITGAANEILEAGKKRAVEEKKFASSYTLERNGAVPVRCWKSGWLNRRYSRFFRRTSSM